jgi:integrase
MPVRQDEENRWHVEVCIDRRRVHRRLPAGATKKDATSLEAEIRKSLEAGKITSDPPLTKIMSLYLAHAKTLRSESTAKFHAMRMEDWIKGKPASEAKQCAAIMVKEMLTSYKPATINRSIGTLKKALSLAWEQGIIPVNYGEQIKRIPENNAREVFLTMAEVKKITEHASENVAAAIWIAIYTGMRRGEICKLEKSHIHKDMIVIPAGNTKTLKTRAVPITKAVRPWLKYIPLPINFEGLKSGFDRARKAAGMPHVHFHDLRHSTASLLVQNGVDLYTVSKILGHSSTKMSERYAHVKVDQQRAALNKIFGK